MTIGNSSDSGNRSGNWFQESVLGDRSCDSGELVLGTGFGVSMDFDRFAMPEKRVPDPRHC